MKQITLAVLLLFNLHLFSQASFNSESYRVTLDDIEINTFEKDTTANAIVIYEEGNSYVNNADYKLTTEEKHKVKILKREGFDKATITIYLYNNNNNAERIENIIATTYNKIDGKVIKTQLEEKDVFKETYNENYTAVKFTLPNIKEGSVITYSYKLISPYMFKYKGWSFQSDIPKLYSDYTASIPGNWLYNIKLVGYKPLDISTSEIKKNCLEGSRGAIADCSINHYAMKDVPAFVNENYMTTKSNYIARIEFELKTFQGFDGIKNDYTKTWETVDDELKSEPNIGRQLVKSVDSDELLSPDIINETNTLKKAALIYAYVQENYIWNDKNEIFKNVSVKDLVKDKSGNVASINILLHNLLKDNEIDVKPVLISTRENGFPTKIYPVISDFNYLIVHVTIDKKTYLLDATDAYLNFGDIPFRCLNQYGRLLDFKKGSSWIDLKPNKASTVLYSAELTVSDDATISGKINSKRTGYHAFNQKKSYYKNADSYIDQLENKFPYINISDFNVLDADVKSDDFKESYNINYNYEAAGDNIYLNPFFVKFFNKNPFKLQDRTYPIDFGYEDTYYYLLKLEFTDAFTIAEKPNDLSLSLPNNAGNIIFSSTIMGNGLNVLLKINFKEPIYPADYYPYLKEFMKKIVDIQTNSLVLIKKT